MKIQGERFLPFPRQAVWDALMDPEVLSRTLPGCQKLERRDETTFEGQLQVAIGPVRGAFRGTLAMSELAPPEGYSMRLDGQGPSGFLKGEGGVELVETEDGGASGTTLRYDLDAQVGGRIAGVGQRLLDSSAKVIAGQGLDGLERQLAARHPTGDSTETPSRSDDALPEAPAAPSQAAFAAAVAQGVARDLIPPHVRLRLAIAVAFALGLALGLWLGGGA